MKVSHSTQQVPLRFVNSRYNIKNESRDKIENNNELEETYPILINISKNDELEPTFVDTFSRLLNNTCFDFQGEYEDVKVTTYSQFYETLRNLKNQMNRAKPCRDFNQRLMNLAGDQRTRVKKAKSFENPRKGSIQILPKQSKKYLFSFEACDNSIVLLIDLSNYMLLYDYSTKSYLLQNIEQIVRDLFIQLERHYNDRKNGNSGPGYFISCYVFSATANVIQQILRNEQIFFSETQERKQKNYAIISDICSYLNRSKLPYEQPKGQSAISISKIIQRVLNLQESNKGIKAIITISSFKQFDYCPYIFFTSGWYTFCFLFAGLLNFGSFLIDTDQITNRFSKSPYLETKFVYKCQFLENWQKVNLIQSEGVQFKYLDKSVKKGRAILYISNKGQRKQSIFDDILKFNIRVNEKRKKFERSNQSIPGMVKNQKKLLYMFDIAAENISEILRLKYLQGWEQISTERFHQNTKYKFKLDFYRQMAFYFQATRTQNIFNIKVYSNLEQCDSSMEMEKLNTFKEQIQQMIKKIDLINTSNFEALASMKDYTVPNKNKGNKLNTKYNYYLKVNEKDINSSLNDIFDDHQRWGCFFKVRKIFIQFTPNNRFTQDFNQLLSELAYLFGERVFSFCFLNRKQIKQKICEDIEERDVSRWKIIFTKASAIIRYIEFKFGFLKFTDNEIKQHLQSIQAKLISKKFVNGSIKIIPEDIYNYCLEKFQNPHIQRKGLSGVFQKIWKIGFKNDRLCRVFFLMNNLIIKKLGYNLLVNKQSCYYYYRIVNLNEKGPKKEKVIFLQMTPNKSNTMQFKLEAFPSFSLIQNSSLYSSQKTSLQQIYNNNSDRNLYQFTQRSISSSNREFSIGSASLPLIGNASKDSGKVNGNGGKSKSSFLELFNWFVEELKQCEKKAANLIKGYTQIYEVVLRKKIEQKKVGLQSEQLIFKIKQIYQISGEHFEDGFHTLLMQIKKENYNDQTSSAKNSNIKGKNVRNVQQNITNNLISNINIDDIPQPNYFLVDSSLSNIKGDLTLSSKAHPEKKYVFFLLTPNTIAYIWRKPDCNQIFYRLFSNIYSECQKQQFELRSLFVRQLIKRIDKQLKQEKYLQFYKVVSQLSYLQDGNQLSTVEEKIKQGQKNGEISISIDCRQIIEIIGKQKIETQNRINSVVKQMKQKFFSYVELFFQNGVFGNTDRNRRKSQQGSGFKQGAFQNFYFQKKNLSEYIKLQQYFIQKSDLETFNQFESIVLKLSDDEGDCLHQENFFEYVKGKKNKSEKSSCFIKLSFFSFKLVKQNPKLLWLQQMLESLLSEAIIYLTIVTSSNFDLCKDIENKFYENIVKGPSLKIPDKLGGENQMKSLVQSTYMRKLIPFYQYSNIYSQSKYVAQGLLLHQNSVIDSKKMSLNCWLTLQITPARIVKTSFIPFKFISLHHQIDLNTSSDFEAQMKRIIDNYLQEFLKFSKIRHIFSQIENQLTFPLDPPIPIFINQSIFLKQEQQKKKSMKNKVPKKFKNFTTQSSFLDTNTSYRQSFRLSQSYEETQKNYFKLPLIYQGSIYPKFKFENICRELTCNQKLNPYAIRNLENAYIFFNPNVREHFIFYLEDSLGSDSSPKLSSDKKKHSNNVLNYYVYCIDQAVDKNSVQKLHGGLIRKALEEVTFYKIASTLVYSNHVIDQTQQEYFKNSQKINLMYKIPHIGNKSNLNQYIKQHLQKCFSHKKIQFRTQIKRRQTYEQPSESFSKDDHKLSIRSRKSELGHNQECDMRCIPQTWVFNTFGDKNKDLQPIYGKCMFLTKISFRQSYDTVCNAFFWQRQIRQGPQNEGLANRKNEKIYIYPLMGQIDEEGHSEASIIEDYLRQYWRQKEKQREKSDKKQRKASHTFSIGELKSSSIRRKQSIEEREKEKEDFTLFDEFVFRQAQDNQYQTTVKFQLSCPLSIPRLKLVQIMYRQAVFYGLFDYYFENQLFASILFTQKLEEASKKSFNSKTSAISSISQFSQQNSVSKMKLHRVQSLQSPLKKELIHKQSFTITKFSEELRGRGAYQYLLEKLKIFESQLQFKKSSSLFSYKTENRLLIENKLVILLLLVEELCQNFHKQFPKKNEKLNMTFVIYGSHRKGNNYHFWVIQILKTPNQNKNERASIYNQLFLQIQKQINVQRYDFSKMGILFTDFLHDLSCFEEKNMLRNTNDCNKFFSRNQSGNYNIEFQWLKNFDEGRSFCQNYYMFKRSLLLHYQVFDSDFLCYTYNLAYKQIKNILAFLQEIQLWFAQKQRLFVFISKIKKLQQRQHRYQVPPEIKISMNHFLHVQYTKPMNSRQSNVKLDTKNLEQGQAQVNLTKLIKSIAFDELPPKNFIKARASIQKMYSILASKPVRYNRYPEYKGTQKSKLAKVARQYLSIIRYEFGVQRSPRKQSTQDRKSQKNQNYI